MATPLAKIAYRRRKELSEPTFGIMKEQLGFRRFLLRGLDNVKAETFMVATAFNLCSCTEYGIGSGLKHGKLGLRKSVPLFLDYFSD